MRKKSIRSSLNFARGRSATGRSQNVESLMNRAQLLFASILFATVAVCAATHEWVVGFDGTGPNFAQETIY
jgi:hypothetical protein